MPHLVEPVVAPGRMRAAAQPVLEAGPDIRLVPWHLRHVDPVRRAFTDPEIQRWHVRRMSSPLEAHDWIGQWSVAWRAETDAAWAVTDAATGRVLGHAAVREIELTLGWAQTTYWVVPDARGAGVSVAAVGRLVRWSFDDLQLHRLEIVHSVDNPASCRVADHVGFELEGTLRSAMLHADGWHDMHLHAIVRDAG
jgi:RimJ/RimL family protein N-acetyltransferase